LAAVLRQVDDSVLLVPSRILRRVIKKHRQLGGLGLQVPHRKSYNIDRETLLKIATPSELGLTPDRALPEMVLLLPAPLPEQLPRWNPGAWLLAYWRLLFHGRAHCASPRLGRAEVAQRIAELGQLEFEEARAVLAQENLLLATDDAAVWE